MRESAKVFCWQPPGLSRGLSAGCWCRRRNYSRVRAGRAAWRATKDRRDAFSNALAVMLPLSVVSAAEYSLRGAGPGEKLGILVIPAVLGGLLGGILLYRIKARWLRLLFSAVVVWSGVSMLTG